MVQRLRVLLWCLVLKNNMRIKKKNYNEYLIIDEGIWIRNFTLPESPPLDQNLHLFTPEDLTLCLNNETQNYKLKLPPISSEQFFYDTVVVVSDGFDFETKKSILMKLTNNVCIIGTNNVLSKWSEGRFRPMTYYVVNNPYSDCLRFLPRKNEYFPTCIASSKTYSPFIKKFIDTNVVYFYTTTPNRYYSGIEHSATHYYIDDYRNPICAALGLAYRFMAKKILLFCHDDCFLDERPTSVKVDNNLWAYPQQLLSNSIINAYLYWFKDLGTTLRYHSTGLKLSNAEYIPLEGISTFLEDT